MLRWALHLFSFFGRAGRREYWLVGVPANVVIWGGTIAFGESDPKYDLFTILVGPVILALVMNVALSVRRLHDRGRTGWWVALYIGGPPGLLFGGIAVSDRLPFEIGTFAVLAILGLMVWAFVDLALLPAGKRASRFGGRRELDQVAAAFD